MRHPTLIFLDLLDHRDEARFNIETYTDLPKGTAKANPDPLLGRHPNKSREEVEALLPEIEAANEAGAGIFIAVNEFNGQRRKENLTRIRGIHADMDGASPDVLEAIRTKLPPTLEVETSGPANLHFYWLLEDGEAIDLETAEALNRRLVDMGADRAAIDVSRLLRLPGFRHMKYREGIS
ncbi:DNA-primase RepB domain-containing protein [Altererythrobacter sp. GH1-8]|uniref:DNA-primase RepB domain-containing protein n=1 Tax=Altererythrobacter sp. GH1-8 TaxID=3349333 RepID=UPI00374D2AF5